MHIKSPREKKKTDSSNALQVGNTQHTQTHTHTLSPNRFELFIRFANTTEIIKLLIAQSENESQRKEKKRERNDRCVFALASRKRRN